MVKDINLNDLEDWEYDEKDTNMIIEKVNEFEEEIDEQRKIVEDLILTLKKTTKIHIPRKGGFNTILKSIREEWMTFSDIAGPAKILRSNNVFQKHFWIILLIFLFGLTIYYMIIIVNAYLAYSQVTSISYIWSVPVTFPVITICNLNPFFIENLSSPYSNQQINNYSNYSNYFGFNLSDIDSNSFSDLVNYQRLFAAVKYNLSQTMYLAAQTQGLNHLISYFESKTLSCSFLGEPCNFQNDFTVYSDTENLFCFKYNSNLTNPKTISNAGLANGFQFTYFLGDSSSEVLNDKRGLRIYIHNQSRIYPVFFNDFQPGIVTNVGLRVKYTQRLSYPYTNCINDLSSNNQNSTTIVQYMFNVLNIRSYSFRLCENIVFTTNLQQTCNCMDKSYLMSDLPYICHTPSQIDCMNSFRNTYSIDASFLCPIGNFIDFSNENKQIIYYLRL